MLGAIAGDIIGSGYEWNATKEYNFQLFTPKSEFTDDTVLTVALADSILNNIDYTIKLKEYYKKYPNRGYGGRFHNWASSQSNEPYNSYGNGSAMRVSPVGWAYDTLEDVLQQAKNSAMPTHNHIEGIKGAQSTAAAIFLARTGHNKKEIKQYIEKTFQYDLSRNYEDIKRTYRFDETCQGSVPEAIIAFLVSTDFEDAVRKAVSLGGDADTQACVAGSIAEAFYKKIPEKIEKTVYSLLDDSLAKITKKFIKKYIVQ